MAFTPTDYDPYDFANRRHIGPSPSEMASMLEVLGVTDLEELIEQTIPANLRQSQPLNFEAPLSERELIFKMRQVAAKNKVFTTMIGQGFYGTVCPPAIQRNILENPAWYTAYTPYQPEISQGRLEALLNFQTVVSDLTGLEVANASLLDEATAAAEAMVMAQRVAKSKARGFFIDENCHPQNIAVMKTRAEPLDIDIIVGAPEELDASAVFGGIFQYPGTYGHIQDFSPQAELLQGASGTDLTQRACRHGCRYCRGVHPAIWRAHGLRWSVSGLHGLQSCLQAQHAGKDRRCFDRRPRKYGLSLVPADPGAAYSAREGDV